MKNCHRILVLFVFLVISLLLFSLSSLAAEQANPRVVETGPSDKLILPPPNATRAVANPASVIPWPKDKTLTAPAGFEVSLFADELDNPRMIYVLPNGDVLVMESLPQQSTSRIVLLRDSAKSGTPTVRQSFLRRLNMAFGMALIGNRFYVGNTDGIVVFPTAPAIRKSNVGRKRSSIYPAAATTPEICWPIPPARKFTLRSVPGQYR